LASNIKKNKKFELLFTRRAKAYSSSGSVVYKYQILYLDRITIVAWRQSLT